MVEKSPALSRSAAAYPDHIYEKSCDDPDCLCRDDFSWPDNIKDGCSKTPTDEAG